MSTSPTSTTTTCSPGSGAGWKKAVRPGTTGSPAPSTPSSHADATRGSTDFTESSELATELAIPTSFGGPQYESDVSTVSARKYGIMMVGLPARGKTFMAHKLCRYFGWLGHSARVFNVQRVWKEILAGRIYKPGHKSVDSMERLGSTPASPPTGGTGMFPQHSSGPQLDAPKFSTYDFSDPEHLAKYRDALNHTKERVQRFYDDGGLVAFINDDFTDPNLREEAEKMYSEICDQIIYIEVIRDENSAFDNLKIRSAGEYGADIPDSVATEDFKKRVALLSKTYKPVGKDKRYIKVSEGSTIETHKVAGYLPSRMVSFLMNLSQTKTSYPVFFSRHGQTTYNKEDRLGGNPLLTEKGHRDAQYLKAFIGENLKCNIEEGNVEIWTSQLTRTMQTANPTEKAFGLKCLRWSALNEIHAGVCEGLTYADVKRDFPLIHDFRKQQKYSFRYPQGESYQDLVARLEPVIMELESATSVVLVVAHQAVLRGLLAYFNEASAQSSVELDIPHRTVWRWTSSSDGSSTLEEQHLDDWIKQNPHVDIPADLPPEVMAQIQTPSPAGSPQDVPKKAE